MKYDVIVIGSGPGGYVAAIRAAQLGLKTACVEKEKTLGGTCLNVGCIPSKALLQSTEYYDLLMHEGQEHGIEFRDLNPNFAQMMTRKAQVVEGLVNGVAGAFKKKGVTHISGMARFISPKEIEVTQDGKKETFEANQFIIATGSEAVGLPFLPFDEKVVVSSTGALSLPTIPKKMLVIGAGVIGVELASVYRRLGAEVIIIEMLDRVCTPMDETMSKQLQRVLEKQGITFHLGAKVKSGKVDKDQVTLEVQTKEGESVSFTGDVVLVAVGRKPYTKDLNAEAAGVQVSPRGFIPVDQRFRTNQPHIYAIGDVIDGMMLAHRASEEGVAVAELLAGENPHVNYLAIPNVIYTHPEVAALGYTEKEARDLNLELLIGQCTFKANARARCMGYTEGLVKIIGEKKSGRLIGMHIIGPHASEMIGEGVLAIAGKVTLQELAHRPHAHPTLNEAIWEATLNALGRSIHY